MYILLDIGGTNTRIAASKDLETFGEPAIFSTPQKYDEALRAIAEHARGVAGAEKIEKMVQEGIE